MDSSRNLGRWALEQLQTPDLTPRGKNSGGCKATPGLYPAAPFSTSRFALLFDILPKSLVQHTLVYRMDMVLHMAVGIVGHPVAMSSPQVTRSRNKQVCVLRRFLRQSVAF